MYVSKLNDATILRSHRPVSDTPLRSSRQGLRTLLPPPGSIKTNLNALGVLSSWILSGMPYVTSLRLSLGFMAVIQDSSCVGAFSTSAQRMHLPPMARQRRSTVTSEASVLGVAEEWFQAAPYTSAFCVTALKASLSDVLAQSNELHGSVVPKQPHSDGSTEKMEHKILKEIVWQRTLAFLLYGGLYQGCAQYWIFNECFPAWFGDGHDFLTVASEVLMDQFILTPFLCLPIAYLFKAVVFRYSLFEGMQRYAADAQRDLLIKYWLLWGPVQCLTFGVVPQQWRIPFIAVVSFFWLMMLSTISSRADR